MAIRGKWCEGREGEELPGGELLKSGTSCLFTTVKWPPRSSKRTRKVSSWSGGDSKVPCDIHKDSRGYEPDHKRGSEEERGNEGSCAKPRLMRGEEREGVVRGGVVGDGRRTGQVEEH